MCIPSGIFSTVILIHVFLIVSPFKAPVSALRDFFPIQKFSKNKFLWFAVGTAVVFEPYAYPFYSSPFLVGAF